MTLSCKILALLTVILPAAFVASPAATAGSPAATAEPAPPAAIDTGAQPAGTPDTTIIVYYFHGDRRCKTCKAIEEKTGEALKSGFPEAIQSGVITFKAVNIDRDENKHFETEYELLFSSVVVSKQQNGSQLEWKNLSKVWELVWDTPEFTDYIQTQVTAYMGS